MKSNSRTVSRHGIGIVISVLIILLFPFFLARGEPGDTDDKLDSVLKHMEESSGSFKSFTADIIKKKYTAILEEFDPSEKGKFYYKRAKDGSALIKEEITEPALKVTTIQNDEALLYQPKIKSASLYKLGKHKDKAEYLALGIGQSPTDLLENFNISYKGIDTINGAACSILELKPKDPKGASIFSSITVWIKVDTGVSTQVKLEEPYDDYILVNFSNETLNEKIDDTEFRQKLPKDVEIIRMN